MAISSKKRACGRIVTHGEFQEKIRPLPSLNLGVRKYATPSPPEYEILTSTPRNPTIEIARGLLAAVVPRKPLPWTR